MFKALASFKMFCIRGLFEFLELCFNKFWLKINFRVKHNESRFANEYNHINAKWLKFLMSKTIAKNTFAIYVYFGKLGIWNYLVNMVSK